jgi:hypothetical protein
MSEKGRKKILGVKDHERDKGRRAEKGRGWIKEWRKRRFLSHFFPFSSFPLFLVKTCSLSYCSCVKFETPTDPSELPPCTEGISLLAMVGLARRRGAGRWFNGRRKGG